MKIHSVFPTFSAMMILAIGGIIMSSACPSVKPAQQLPTLAEARKGFSTKLLKREVDQSGAATPAPVEIYDTIQYKAPLGKQDAYVSINPKDGKKHPAIIWIPGSFFSSINLGTATTERLPIFASSGIIAMLPSLRGGNANPGCKEYFVGELDDILAAADHLAQLPYVDKNRIYLAGTSTGGTTALLAAEYTDRFRAIFAYGPAAEVAGYGQARLPFDCNDASETRIRSPLHWMHCVKNPTFVMEGDVGSNNIAPLNTLKKANRNPLIHFFPVPGATHRNVPDVVNPLIAKCILADVGPTCSIELTQELINTAFKAYQPKIEPVAK